MFSADDNAELADNTLDELLRFITGLRVKRVIQKEESDALEELLFNNRLNNLSYFLMTLQI